MLMDSTTPKPPVRQEAKPSLASWKLRGALQISLACSSDTGIARPAWQRLEARFWFKSGAGLTNQTAKWPYCLTSHIWIVGTVASSPTHIVAAAKSKASQTTPLPRGKSRTQHPENFTSLAPSSVQQQSYHILQNTQKLCCETSHVTNIHTIYIYIDDLALIIHVFTQLEPPLPRFCYLIHLKNHFIKRSAGLSRLSTLRQELLHQSPILFGRNVADLEDSPEPRSCADATNDAIWCNGQLSLV